MSPQPAGRPPTKCREVARSPLDGQPGLWRTPVHTHIVLLLLLVPSCCSTGLTPPREGHFHSCPRPPLMAREVAQPGLDSALQAPAKGTLPPLLSLPSLVHLLGPVQTLCWWPRRGESALPLLPVGCPPTPTGPGGICCDCDQLGSGLSETLRTLPLIKVPPAPGDGRGERGEKSSLSCHCAWEGGGRGWAGPCWGRGWGGPSRQAHPWWCPWRALGVRGTDPLCQSDSAVRKPCVGTAPQAPDLRARLGSQAPPPAKADGEVGAPHLGRRPAGHSSA